MEYKYVVAIVSNKSSITLFSIETDTRLHPGLYTILKHLRMMTSMSIKYTYTDGTVRFTSKTLVLLRKLFTDCRVCIADGIKLEFNTSFRLVGDLLDFQRPVSANIYQIIQSSIPNEPVRLIPLKYE
jgi:hypothetical protein